jgi:hypothetical protein
MHFLSLYRNFLFFSNEAVVFLLGVKKSYTDTGTKFAMPDIENLQVMEGRVTARRPSDGPPAREEKRGRGVASTRSQGGGRGQHGPWNEEAPHVASPRPTWRVRGPHAEA